MDQPYEKCYNKIIYICACIMIVSTYFSYICGYFGFISIYKNGFEQTLKDQNFGAFMLFLLLNSISLIICCIWTICALLYYKRICDFGYIMIICHKLSSYSNNLLILSSMVEGFIIFIVFIMSMNHGSALTITILCGISMMLILSMLYHMILTLYIKERMHNIDE